MFCAQDDFVIVPARCFSRKALSSSSISFFSFLGAFKGLALPPGGGVSKCGVSVEGRSGEFHTFSADTSHCVGVDVGSLGLIVRKFENVVRILRKRRDLCLHNLIFCGRVGEVLEADENALVPKELAPLATSQSIEPWTASFHHRNLHRTSYVYNILKQDNGRNLTTINHTSSSSLLDNALKDRREETIDTRLGSFSQTRPGLQANTILHDFRQGILPPLDSHRQHVLHRQLR